jgi:hypothetical protein
MKRVAVIQSNYIPWKGYFDIIHDVDLFVFYDDVQFTKNDWRNRNKIKTPRGVQWLSVPVGADLNRRICEVELNDKSWAQKHWKTLEQNYRKAPYFNLYAPVLRDLYLNTTWNTLSDLNHTLIRWIATEALSIEVEFRDSREYVLQGERQDRLLALLEQVGATHYVSGPSARSYIEPERFSERGIELHYKDYSGYPTYDQLHPPFEHGVTVLDTLFHLGTQAHNAIWGWRDT